MLLLPTLTTVFLLPMTSDVQGRNILSSDRSGSESRLKDIVSRMTLEEKVRMLFGGEQPEVSQLPGVSRLGIPPMYPTDGPRGITSVMDTAFPAGIGLGSTWDMTLMGKIGSALGQEARADGKNMVYAPAINIERDPLGGRFFEYLTEDPYLDARLTVPMVRGIQGERVAACVKHFAANNREWNRDWYSSNVDERSLQEIYLPAFKAAVEEGGAWALMTAANGVNHQLAAQSHFLLTDVLRDQWRFDGLTLTDYNHARGTEAAASAGLDISMPWGDWATETFAKPLMDSVATGKLPVALIDEKVTNILRVRERVGLLDGLDPHAGGSANTPEHQALARKAAEESLVLLKNEHHVLPLNGASMKTVVVVGPNADRAFTGGGLGGSSGVHAPYEITVLAGLRKRLGEAHVKYLPLQSDSFEVIDSRYLTGPTGEPGIEARYANDHAEGPPLIRSEPSIDFNWEMRSPDPKSIHTDNFTAHYSGLLTPQQSGYYVLRLSGENSATLFMGGQPLLTNHAEGGFHRATAGVTLVAGRRYEIAVDYHASAGDASVHLEWALPDAAVRVEEEVRREALMLRGADAVIFVGGWDYGQDNEGLDRETMDFPAQQARTIRAIAALNPKTVVVLLHGSPFTLADWLPSVPAVLDAWYPGMEGGTAVAEAILGDTNPGGKLAFSWPRRLQDSPTYSLGTADKNNVNYNEGVFVGYRYFDSYKVSPQFPFGFGLSYSRVTYHSLSARQRLDGVQVSFWLSNKSYRAATEIAQIYVSPPYPLNGRPVQELRGFQRVELLPRESKRVDLTLSNEAFRHWDVHTHSWHQDYGTFTVQAGSSSRELPLRVVVKRYLPSNRH